MHPVSGMCNILERGDCGGNDGWGVLPFRLYQSPKSSAKCCRFVAVGAVWELLLPGKLR